MLLQGKAHQEIVGSHSELDKHSMNMQLAMLHGQFTYHTVDQARVQLQAMCPEVRAVFGQVQ